MDIITTIGPASWCPEVMTSLVQLGIRGVRFPFAKETPKEHVQRSLLLAQLATKHGNGLQMIADLPGGKPRLSNPVPITVSSEKAVRIRIATDDVPDGELRVFPTLTLQVARQISKAIIGDGENEFMIESHNEGVLSGRFLRSGVIERHRAFLPVSNEFVIESFTERDRSLARVAKEGSFDFLALSFVDCAQDIANARAWLLRELRWEPKIIAKIETLRGVENSAEIARSADAVMVARGDLAVQVGLEKLWDCQKRIIDTCQRQAKYVITATGILESMVKSPFPTRAEVIDVCASLTMGSNALMLSAETTIGAYPREVVAFLRNLSAAYCTRTG